ncbi:uncharacterized protein LOC131156703 isoform X2 [Malania oleifera]|uniref:uncharacterized protein LOC131156703 isoform X2 n=1 Tax=Malania oleifera TaxID=397392 RepID=UPI0025ADFFF8|nr:uncharacterized protein LOC131156703 isoform X2 [Malania oleifera]
MEVKGIEVGRKRMKSAIEEKDGEVGDGPLVQMVEEENEMNIAGSEEMKHSITRIHERIEHFTQLVSELLESGKAILKELTDEFEERLIAIHKAQVEKWQEEIRELQLLDGSNEEVNALLDNARYLIQNIQVDS